MGPWLVYASLFNGAAMALFNVCDGAGAGLHALAGTLPCGCMRTCSKNHRLCMVLRCYLADMFMVA